MILAHVTKNIGTVTRSFGAYTSPVTGYKPGFVTGNNRLYDRLQMLVPGMKNRLQERLCKTGYVTGYNVNGYASP